ncbi:MAG: hypothetical protein U0L19_03950 [Bacteroidales bacterium]|nr:hypothetical protein [Bacteroidales bacterium]
MPESANERLFRTKVLPIMDKVMADLRHKQAEEMERHTSSMPYIFAGAAGPDGGMAAQAASLDTLRYTGKWNSKHTKDYINMVKDELKKQKITVTPEIEKMMIDKMIKDEVPKSSIEYIIRKAATNTIFYLPQAMNKSPLEKHISEQAERQYNPSRIEKGAGYVLGATADYLSLGGVGGTLTGGAKFVGVDLALNAVLDKATENIDTSYPTSKPMKPTTKNNTATGDDDVPMIIAPEYREQYKAEQAKRKAEQPQKPVAKVTPTENTQQAKEEEARHEPQTEPSVQTQAAAEQSLPQQTNQSGWSGLLSSFGLNGISDIGNNLGYVLAMLPDALIGALTGKTKSLGLKDNLMPLASIVAGMFVRNPILKMVLVGMGGLNLLNKAGHEAIENHAGQNQAQRGSLGIRANYKVYADEPLNPRVLQPQIRGNCLIATIDKVPCTIALPDKVVDAYNQGALPLNTLVNAVLAKNDQMRQLASENYEAQQRTETRALAQR